MIFTLFRSNSIHRNSFSFWVTQNCTHLIPCEYVCLSIYVFLCVSLYQNSLPNNPLLSAGWKTVDPVSLQWAILSLWKAKSFILSHPCWPQRSTQRKFHLLLHNEWLSVILHRVTQSLRKNISLFLRWSMKWEWERDKRRKVCAIVYAFNNLLCFKPRLLNFSYQTSFHSIITVPSSFV